jgi:hypothetical protein
MNNALKYVKILEGTGITREQAEAHVQIISDILEGDLVTKQDLLNSEHNIKNAFERFETSINTSITQLDSKINTSVSRLDNKIDTAAQQLENKMLQLEYRMTIKLGSIVTVAIAAMTAVIKFL